MFPHSKKVTRSTPFRPKAISTLVFFPQSKHMHSGLSGDTEVLLAVAMIRVYSLPSSFLRHPVGYKEDKIVDKWMDVTEK